jgi:integrase
MTYAQLDFAWKRVRDQAGLSHVRFKDPRAKVAITGEEAGIPQTVLARTMGHSDEMMTRRYQQRAAVLSAEQAEAIEAAMLGNGGGGRDNTASTKEQRRTA